MTQDKNTREKMSNEKLTARMGVLVTSMSNRYLTYQGGKSPKSMVIEYTNEINHLTKELSKALYTDKDLAKFYRTVPQLIRAVQGYLHFNAIFMEKDPTDARVAEERKNIYKHYGLYQWIEAITPPSKIIDMTEELAKVMRNYDPAGEYTQKGRPTTIKDQSVVDAFTSWSEALANG